MFENSQYVGVPIGAFLCFLFIFLCFLNTLETKAVRYFRQTILICLVWTGGAVLMRLQVWPGLAFWYHVSLFGIFLLPVVMYQFLMYMLDILRKEFIFLVGLASCILLLANCITGCILPPPHEVQGSNGAVAYTYTTGPAIGVFVAVDVVIFCAVVYQVLVRVRGNKQMKKRLAPMIVGALFVLGGNILELMPGNQFPYDTLGGVFMAFSLVYIMYKQFLFDLGDRLVIGFIYTLSFFAASVPYLFVARRVLQISDGNHSSSEGMAAFLVLFLCIWTAGMLALGQKCSEFLTEKKKRQLTLTAQRFQTRTASLFSRAELFDLITDTVQKLVGQSNIWILEKDAEAPKGYRIVYSFLEEKKDLDNEELLDQLVEGVHNKNQGFLTLEYDNEEWGALCIETLRGASINDNHITALKQVGISASICLKNISIYDKVYENSIHDELTGLYNRTYSREYLEDWDAERKGLLLMDLDNFKLVNELYGEEKGDEILKWSADKISKAVGNQGKVFRSGSNEFLVAMETQDKQELLALAEKIRADMETEDDKKPEVMQPITLSMGISVQNENFSTSEELLKHAERAVFFAKRNGKNRIEVYERELDVNDSGQSKGYEQIAPTVYALMAAIDAKDSYTFEHSSHVSDCAVILAKKLGMKQEEIQIIKEAGLFHDIGKISIPESILKKTGKLTREEYEIMKTHVTKSIEIIHYLPNMDYVIPAVVSHHERYDGKGYPRGLKGEEIPFMGRILAVCDSFDAMVSKRTYKDAMTLEYAVEELERNKGTQFDPVVAEAFIGLIQEGIIV